MSKVLVSEEYLQDIADAIRTKTESVATYTPAQMAEAIMNIAPGSSLTRIFHGYESVYRTDTTSPVELDANTETYPFGAYVSTADYATFTALQDMVVVVTVGVKQDTEHTSSNKPSGGFYVNGQVKISVQSETAESGSTGVDHTVIEIKQGDTFYWSSIDMNGWAVRMGALDLIENLDMSGYVEPGWSE